MLIFKILRGHATEIGLVCSYEHGLFRPLQRNRIIDSGAQGVKIRATTAARGCDLAGVLVDPIAEIFMRMLQTNHLWTPESEKTCGTRITIASVDQIQPSSIFTDNFVSDFRSVRVMAADSRRLLVLRQIQSDLLWQTIVGIRRGTVRSQAYRVPYGVGRLRLTLDHASQRRRPN